MRIRQRLYYLCGIVKDTTNLKFFSVLPMPDGDKLVLKEKLDFIKYKKADEDK